MINSIHHEPVPAHNPSIERLQEALSSATASEQRMRQLLADASHELRTPLTVLRGASQMLIRRPSLDQSEVDAALAAIDKEATRLSRLVDDLLSLTRLDAGQPLHPLPVALSRFLEEFAARHTPVWPERTITLDRSTLNGAQVYVDPEALTRILTNLVENAARYSTAGKPILIRGEAVGGTVSIQVQDQGPGLSPEEARRVFERFYRGSTSRSGRHPAGTRGSGLGLAIVRALVQQSRGEIHIDTGPDRGTIVAITLPRAGGT